MCADRPLWNGVVNTPEQIIALVRDAGVIGAAGVGFPTWVKLQTKVETVIVNGSECEPLLYTDKTILKNKAEDVVEGLKLAMAATHAKKGIIAMNADHRDVIDAIKKVIYTHAPYIKIHLLGNYYPAGDELLMVYDVTKKIIPENGTPASVDVAVLNVSTIVQIYQAVNGKPATERVVTITGEVKEPKVLTVPVGTRYSELIALAGGSTLKEFSVLDGGPMMGNIVTDLDQGIGKSTCAIVLLPSDHYVIRMKSKTLAETVKQSRAASGQNTQCTDLCPRHLLGHEINPHQAMMAIDYHMAEPSAAITSAFLCSGCGLCEMVGNDSTFLSPKLIYSEYKRLLTKAKIKNPHTRSGFSVNSQFENRKMPTHMLVKKLGIGQYEQKLSFHGIKEVSLVKIPIQKHMGSLANTVVKIGQQVRRGDVIARSPVDQVGRIYHASIHGNISAITDDFVEITGHLS
jgi:Na+-translocating ferredoxin:NAD+ oxidoreductase RnfC subunit